jgi:hypothetical protein
MTNEELSWEETNHLYKLCAIPMLFVFFIMLIYFNYLMYTGSLKTRWDFIILIALPFFIFFPTAGMVTFELVYHQKIKKSLKFHVKRFMGRTLLLLVSVLSFFGFLIITQQLLYPIISDLDVIVGSVLWVVAFALVILRFRKLFAKLDRGEW